MLWSDLTPGARRSINFAQDGCPIVQDISRPVIESSLSRLTGSLFRVYGSAVMAEHEEKWFSVHQPCLCISTGVWGARPRPSGRLSRLRNPNRRPILIIGASFETQRHRIAEVELGRSRALRLMQEKGGSRHRLGGGFGFREPHFGLDGCESWSRVRVVAAVEPPTASGR
jgi:hypothetical protein